MSDIISLVAGYEMGHLGKPIDYHEDRFLFLWVLEKPRIKPILTSTYDKVGTGSGVYSS